MLTKKKHREKKIQANELIPLKIPMPKFAILNYSQFGNDQDEPIYRSYYPRMLNEVSTILQSQLS